MDFEGDTHGPKIAKLADGEDRFSNIVDDGVRGSGDPANGPRLVPRDADLGNLAKTQVEDNLAQHPAFARRDTSATS